MGHKGSSAGRHWIRCQMGLSKEGPEKACFGPLCIRSWKKCGCNVCTISCSWGGRGLEKRWEINSRKASLHKDECSTPQGSGRVVKTSVVSFSEEWINECNFSHWIYFSARKKKNRLIRQDDFLFSTYIIAQWLLLYIPDFCCLLTLILSLVCSFLISWSVCIAAVVKIDHMMHTHFASQLQKNYSWSPYSILLMTSLLSNTDCHWASLHSVKFPNYWRFVFSKIGEFIFYFL